VQIVIIQKESSLSSFRASALLKAWRVTMVFLMLKIGLWNAPRRKVRLASICMAVRRARWWGMDAVSERSTDHSLEGSAYWGWQLRPADIARWKSCDLLGQAQS
jgi:hypothetical protein